jgi:hypothetical protein
MKMPQKPEPLEGGVRRTQDGADQDVDVVVRITEALLDEKRIQEHRVNLNQRGRFLYSCFRSNLIRGSWWRKNRTRREAEVV